MQINSKFYSLFAAALLLVGSNANAEVQKPTFTFIPKSTVRLDSLTVHNNKRSFKDRFFFRDAIFGGKGIIFSDFKYRVDLNFSSTVRDRIQQAYVEYKKFDPYIIKVGRFFPSFFLSYDRSFNEWPAAGALVVQLKDGVQLRTYGDNWTVYTSYGNSGSFSKSQAENKRDAFYLKGTYLPLYDKKNNEFFHIGLSNSYLKPKGVLKYKGKPEARVKGVALLQTPPLTHVNYGNISNLSLAYSNKSFSTQVEYLMSNLNRDAGYDNLLYHGGYAQVAYFLTGESKQYDSKKGEIKSINPIDPVFEFGKKTNKNGVGAWEIAAKYSTMDLNSKIKSGKMDIYGLGLNWFLNNNLKISNDFLFAKTDKYARIPKSTTKIALLRLHLEF